MQLIIFLYSHHTVFNSLLNTGTITYLLFLCSFLLIHFQGLFPCQDLIQIQTAQNVPGRMSYVCKDPQSAKEFYVQPILRKLAVNVMPIFHSLWNSAFLFFRTLLNLVWVFLFIVLTIMPCNTFRGIAFQSDSDIACTMH